MNIYLNYHYLHASICFIEQIFVENDKFRMKCVNKCDASTEGVSWKFLYLLIDHRNLLYINFLKFPSLFLNFPHL